MYYTNNETGSKNRRQPRRKSSPEPSTDANSILAWIQHHLAFTPDPAQAGVLSTSSPRVILNCTRQWGKSTITAAKAVHQALTKAGSLTLVVSPSARQSGEFVRKAAGFLDKLGIRPRGDGDNEISLLFPNRSRIVGLPATESTVRGFSSVGLLLVDEASRVPDDLYLSVRPMLAVSRGALWLLSTPYGKRGFFWETWEREARNRSPAPGSRPQAPQWQRFCIPATECPRILPDFLEEERAAMGDQWFRQEYLCEFIDTVSSVFDRDLIDRAVSTDFQPLRLK